MRSQVRWQSVGGGVQQSPQSSRSIKTLRRLLALLQGVVPLSIAFVVSCAALTYGAMAVQPIMALILVVRAALVVPLSKSLLSFCLNETCLFTLQAGLAKPAVMIREIKKQKLVDEEEYEEGVGGRMLMCCMCKGAEHEEEALLLDWDEDERRFVKEFIHMLADQVLGRRLA